MKKRKPQRNVIQTTTYRKHRTTRSTELTTLSLDTRGYPTGKDGAVWATFDLRQAEIIRNALLAQRIACELRDIKPDGNTLYLLHVADKRGLEEAMDFIWKDKGGLRLTPDWNYADGEINKSFELWLSGH